MKNIVLTGFMGTGKTEVSRILSQKLNYILIDVDSEIEKEQNITIAEIFKQYGEARLMGNNLRAAKSGNPIRDYGSWVINYRTTIPLQSPTQFVKLKDGEGRLFGIGKIVNDLIKIKRLFVVP
ncbi:hypothetical protein M1N60_02090 [Thermodesulfovibrionales bacterium]|nr:hypothetical protein [Thermodesulfovibrionales bacterium]